MKNTSYLLLILFLINCSAPIQQREIKSEVEIFNEKSKLEETEKQTSTQSIVDSSFHTFIVKFSVDKEFQLTRVKFPLTIKLIDISDEEETRIIAKNEWQHENLHDTSGIENRKIDAYSQTIQVEDSVATIKLRGIDNGIRIDYKFQKKNNRWFLTEIFNSST